LYARVLIEMKLLLPILPLPAFAFAGGKLDPSTWILWRAASIAFPDSITPHVPELMQDEPTKAIGPNTTSTLFYGGSQIEFAVTKVTIGFRY
jgi:hypothetical protein